ncbi:hypothetical protein [Corynebacterium heidelbergense]|uniref:Uncharacterized protein n=1 Tax=Corynebacterium heidelbergense TaxID=2055947 RepID=A0A364VE49_9CORY|nr:hypothetical protein [Corynebacterium heidelbergense]RAV34919.1 hypothetical protein CWC39_00850 [Corynebacterium heidelbergense]WCZ36057.1 hypothetical protein CHEID_02455 [Corynebacterium heidelbergense]
MKIRLLVDQWDEPTEGGYLTHVKGDVVDAGEADAARLVGAGAAVGVPVESEKKEAPKRRVRRGGDK